MTDSDEIQSSPVGGFDSILGPEDPRQISKYEIVSVLGEGGMGKVYLGHDPVMDRKVAVKVISGAHPSDDQVSRFQQEARAMARLQHQGIANVVDFGVTQKQEPFFVLEFVFGVPLDSYLRDHGPLSLDIVIEIFNQIADAMHHAHSKEVVHRDLKPSNIIVNHIEEKPHVFVLDFGIAKILEDNGQVNTKTGQIIGSPCYISPEQIRVEKKIDARADIYSLGCVLYQVLTGQLPFKGDSAIETLQMHLDQTPPPLEISGSDCQGYAIELEEIVSRMLEKEPASRFQSMTEVSEALAAIGSGVEVSTRSRMDGTMTWKRALLLVLAMLIAGLILISVISYLSLDVSIFS